MNLTTKPNESNVEKIEFLFANLGNIKLFFSNNDEAQTRYIELHQRGYDVTEPDNGNAIEVRGMPIVTINDLNITTHADEFIMRFDNNSKRVTYTNYRHVPAIGFSGGRPAFRTVEFFEYN
jgi:hypothetical protein